MWQKMSDEIEESDVILIAPHTKNQDGSQTFLILDPCPTTEECASEIKLIDLTAEVKNTGTIAVLSTNTNTGELEIAFSKKGDTVPQTMDSAPDTVIQLNGTSSMDQKTDESFDDVITDDDLLLKCKIKDEDEDVDIEDCASDDHTRSEPSPINLEEDLAENSQQIDNEQDDDPDEGALFIDDTNHTDFQEELVDHLEENLNMEDNDINEEFKSCVDQTEVKILSEKVNISEEMVVDKQEQVEDITNSKVEVEEVFIPNVSAFDSSVNNFVEVNKEYDVQELQIQKEISTETQYRLDQTLDDSEYGDSTNTALTLLELAGGTSFRNTVEPISVDMEQDKPSVSTDSVTEPKPQTETPTLITLQPVPIETLVEPSSSPEHASIADLNQPTDLPSGVEQASTSDSAKPTRPELPPGHKIPMHMKSTHDMAQCILVSGDTPRLGTKCMKQFKHIITSPIITKDEIEKEIMERSLQKCPYTKQTGGDVIFAMKLAHRLATRIVSPEKALCVEAAKSPEEQIVDVSKSGKNTPIMKDNVTKKLNDFQIPIQKKNAISDKYELLKILEDDPDDIPSTDGGIAINKKPNTDETPVIEKKPIKIKDLKSSRSSPLIKLHPELEKELALKQLEDFKNDQDKRKKKVVFGPNYVKKMVKSEPGTPKNLHEHNNNFNSKNPRTLTKRKSNEPPVKGLKKLKTEKINRETVTADPSQITETLTVEGHELTGDQPKDGKSLKQYSNKRLSRNSETPPREVPMEILLNGVDDLEVENDKDKTKNKIFKATNPRKRQEELKQKRQKHFATMLQQNQPLKKRGRPPKKKPDVKPKDEFFNDELLSRKRPRQSLSNNEVGKQPNILDSKENIDASDKSEKPVKTKNMREIEKLLGDEGAINMLYSVEQKRTTGSEPKRSMLPSYRRKKKDLQLKTKLVKSAVLRLTVSTPQPTGRVSLRGQVAKDGEGEEDNEISLRKLSVDSRDSHTSMCSPPSQIFPFPAKIVPAEASRIIRRHSSSSNYSSRSNSPRRLSVDGERVSITPLERQTTEEGQDEALLPNSGRHSKSVKPQQTSEVIPVKRSERVEKSKELRSTQEQSHENQLVKNKKSEKLTPTNVKSKAQIKSNVVNSPRLSSGRQQKELVLPPQPWLKRKRVELSTTLAAAVEGFTKDTATDGKKTPSDTPKRLASKIPGANLKTRSPKLATEKAKVYRKTTPTVTPVGEKQSVVYKEFSLKRHDHLVEIILSPVSTKLRNTVNTNVLKELIAVLKGLALDENCRVVLVTCDGDTFCQGVDFISLVQPAETRTEVAMEMAVSVKDFIKALAMFAKPVVAGVHGPAMGLGVTMLPLFDMVLSSAHATFHTPYAALGQIPEGAATLLVPTLLGSTLTSELLFASRKLTATEALSFGLVTRILDSGNFREELLSVAGAIASQSSQAMDATKALLRHNLMSGLETTLMSETHLLIQHWVSKECQANFTKYLEADENPFGLQKQPT